jgi:hypothetical protein
MKLRRVRKTIMNTVIERLRAHSTQNIDQLDGVVQKALDGAVGNGTARASLVARLEELIEKDLVQVWPKGTWSNDDDCEYYELTDRCFSDHGECIVHTLIDPEWPS